MKRKAILLLLIPISFCVMIYTNACRKSDRNDDTETQSSADNATAQILFNDVFKQVVYYSDSNSVLKIKAASCDTSWITGSIFPKTLTIKYDSASGCNDVLGVNHKGKIFALMSGKFTDSLATATVTFNNFSINGYRLTGTQKITSKGNIGGNSVFSVSVTNAVITTPSGKIITWNANETYTHQPSTTTTITDDVITITGSSNGAGIEGTTFTSSITSDLHFELGCHWITSGVFTLSPGNLTMRTIDYGSGCNNSATVSFTNKSYTITLP